MKTAVIESIDVKPEFPCCMQTKDGMVVLFSELSIGVVVHQGGGNSLIGYYSRSWIMNEFRALPAGTKIVIEA